LKHIFTRAAGHERRFRERMEECEENAKRERNRPDELNRIRENSPSRSRSS